MRAFLVPVHACVSQVYAFVHEAMHMLADPAHQNEGSLLTLALRIGECNLQVCPVSLCI